MILRANVDLAKRVFTGQLLGKPYVYGELDCSKLVNIMLEALTKGSAMSWARSVNTESWPPGAPVGAVGPYGTIKARWLDAIPADAAAKIPIKHRGGGANSHMEIEVDGMLMEAGDPVCTRPDATPLNSGIWTDYWYLPGPIGGASDPPPPQLESYGLPSGAAVDYGSPGFPAWVYQLCDRWGVKASTYPGHQVKDRRDIGSAPNPQGLNRGIDWAGDPQKMLDFAHWLRDVGPARTFGTYGPPGLEMVIYQDPRSGERVGYPAGVDYGSDYPNHTDHVHTRQSAAIIAAGPAPPAPAASPLVAALRANGSFTEEQIRLIQGFSVVEGLNPAGNPTLGFTDAQLGGDASLAGHVRALAKQFKDRAPVAGPFPAGRSDLEQAQWIARLVGQAGLSSDWQGNAQPTDYVQRVVAAMPPRSSPQPFPEEDELSAEAERMIHDIHAALFVPQPPENIYRSAEDEQHDAKNLVDSIRSILSMVYEGVVERCALDIAEPASLDKVVRVANGRGPEVRPWAVARAMLVWRKGYGTPSPPADAPPAAPTSALPDRRDLELSSVYAENARLREENTRLRQENTRVLQQALQAAVVPVSTELATIEPAAKTIGELAAGVIDPAAEWAKARLTMDPVQQHALEASFQLLKMHTNGTQP